jgi:hypothetical protein
MAREDWETTTGFADDFDFVVTGARFGFIKEYMGGTVPLLIWEGHSPDDDSVTEVSFPIGSGWEVKDNGRRVQHESGKKKFVRNSIVGHLIRRVVDDLKVESILDGSPTDAQVWVGLGFHMKREKIVYPGLKKDDKDGVETERLMPVAFLGTKESSSARSSGPSTSSPAAHPGTNATNGTTDSPLVKKLRLLAQKLERSEFQMKALDMPEVMADDAVMAAVLDDGPGGLWATARAGANA